MKIDDIREALAPFAEFADYFDDGRRPGEALCAISVSLDDLRKVRDANAGAYAPLGKSPVSMVIKDTEALREALGRIAALRSPNNGDYVRIASDALATPASDPDTIGSHFGNGGGFDPDAPANGVAPVEYDTLIAAGFDDYAAHCALWTEPDGCFCYAYFYSDGQWRFQTGGNDLTLPDGGLLRCVLTKPLYAHPQHPAPVDPVAGGEALDFADMRRPIIGIENRSTQDVFNIMADRIRLAEAGHYRLAALQGPAA